MDARLTGIDRRETLQYLAWRGGALPQTLEADLDRCEGQILAIARPRAVWHVFPLTPDGTLEGTRFRPEGEDIRRHLADCDQVILMAATLGAEVEALIRRTQPRSMGDAMILDAAASAAVENVCDNLCADLAAAFAPRFLTDRFSPGYGDLPLHHQRDFSELLDMSRRIGVSLTSSGLMLPQKSVTALIGVSDRPQPRRSRSCADCALSEHCSYRREGSHCGKA